MRHNISFRAVAVLVAFFSVQAVRSYAQMVPVYTVHNDNARTGANLMERTLSPANVNPATFGKLFTQPVDESVFAQILYVPELTIPGKGVHNVIYTATIGGSVYAFDADNASGANSAPLWSTSLLPPGPTVAPLDGVLGTPVIDPATNTLYVDCSSVEDGHRVQRMHALDITTGAPKFGSPTVVAASVPGTGWGAVDGVLTFSENERQRPGLLLLNGVVYATYGAIDEDPAVPTNVVPYHGWLIGFDAGTLQIVSVLCLSPNGYASGIWMSGAGPAADENGFIYLGTGNGNFSAYDGGIDYGDSFVKINTIGGVYVFDYATPVNQLQMDVNDADLGGGGPVLLPQDPTTGIRAMVAVGKDGTIYVANRDQMGRFDPNGNFPFVQTIVKPSNVALTTPAYFNGTIYTCGLNDVPKAFTRSNGLFNGTPSSQATTVFKFPGASGSISANGNTNGILWMLDPSNQWHGGDGILRAYDATNLAIELYNTLMVPTRDFPGLAKRFTVPTVANGKVYTPMSRQVSAFGLLAPAKGDANADGHITMADVAAIMGVAAGLTQPADIALLDVDSLASGALGAGDGIVDLADAVRVLRFISGVGTG